MRDLITLLMIALLVGLEAMLWVKNPMRVPAPYFTARAVGLQLFDEPGTSMEPTIKNGKRVLVASWPYLFDAPRQGDVIAFVYPLDPSVADIKRVVATEGSSIEIRNGTLYVNDKSDDASYVGERGSTAGYPRFMSKRRTPARSYFVMGDNRDQSLDSRSYGFISRDQVIGKLWF